MKKRRKVYMIRNPFPTAADIRAQAALAELWTAAEHFVKHKARVARADWRRYVRIRDRKLRRKLAKGDR